jgi:hypothetical protein
LFFFFQRFGKKFNRFFIAQLFCQGGQGTVTGNFVMLDLLRSGN